MHRLPGTALGLSRYRLDDLLYRHTESQGVEAHMREPVQSISGDLDTGFEVTTDAHTYGARVVVGAYGKRSTLDRKLDRPFIRRNEPFVAFKAHFSGIELGPVIELHAFPGGYCGLSQVEAGLINACWITSADVLRRYGTPEEVVLRCFSANPVLSARFEALDLVSDRYIATSQISFSEKERYESDVCMVGDTAGMIAPLCGDGMAMALRSAELASSALSDYLSGILSASQLRRRYDHAWRSEFRKRMYLGRVAQAGFSTPSVARWAVRCFNRIPATADWLVHATRGQIRDQEPQSHAVTPISSRTNEAVNGQLEPSMPPPC